MPEWDGELSRGWVDGPFERSRPVVQRYAHPSWFLKYVELEREAVSIRAWQSQIVPGLLQTEEYARLMFASARPDTVDELVAARMSRQAIFERDPKPYVWFVIDEGALRRHLGDPVMQRGQLERLLRMGEEPRTVIQVLPATPLAHPGLAGPFTILGSVDGADVVYTGAFHQGRIGDDRAEVITAERTYDLLRAWALPPRESAELIGGYLSDPDGRNPGSRPGRSPG